MYSNILIATDGSDLADKAIQHGLSVAAKFGAKVKFVTVSVPLHTVAPAEVMITFPEEEYDKGAAKHAQEILGKAETTANSAGIACDKVSVVHEQPWQAIVDTAVDDGCDLIVMGSHGRSGLTKLLLGSEAQKVLTHSRVPVLIVR